MWAPLTLIYIDAFAPTVPRRSIELAEHIMDCCENFFIGLFDEQRSGAEESLEEVLAPFIVRDELRPANT
jgi:hypothetical protein